MKKTFRKYEEKLMQDLQDPELANEYLNVALMDGDPQVFLLALKDICKSRGIEMTTLAEKTKLSRENLYRILSRKRNPKLTSIMSLLNAVGLTLAVQENKK